ncbi:MAG: hypothetical protein ACLPND_12160 [Candidatus Korobacteraceae bacterium]
MTVQLLHSETLTRSAERGLGASTGNDRLPGNTGPGQCSARKLWAEQMIQPEKQGKILAKRFLIPA